jgi:hypothetical protein
MHSYLFPFFLLKLLNTVSYSDIFQVREKMVSAMSNVQVDSVTTVQQTSSALNSLLSTPDEVSPDAQVRRCRLQLCNIFWCLLLGSAN